MPLNQNINEELWMRAKRLADKRGQGRNWAYVMSIYKNLEKGHDVKKAASIKPALPDKYFDPDELAEGESVELEHTTDKNVAKRIAKHHLQETDEKPGKDVESEYYAKLKKMERGLKRKRKIKKAETMSGAIDILKAAL